MSDEQGGPSTPGLDDDALDRLLGAAWDEAPGRPEARCGPTELHAERYRDFRTVGYGGMGIVFLALDTELNRPVAVKVVRPPAAGAGDDAGTATPFAIRPPAPESEGAAAYAELCDRFLQEAWLTGALEHPGIVPVYEVGRTPRGVPYYTMRYVRGVRTLETALAGARTAKDRLDLLDPFLHVCDAIRYAHSRGVIHRDLKPVNIGLGEYGEVVVLDWGLAKMGDESDAGDSVWQARIRDFRDARDMRTVAKALGTPGYMSPEAARGDHGSVDERSDVYSLGAILYRILTGRLPFEFDSYLDLLRRLREERPVPASTVDPSVPADLSRICAKALSTTRGERYPGAGRLAAAIRDHQRESRVRSEIRGLMQEAEAGFETAEELSGEPLVRRLDRVRALCLRVLGHRDGHARARRLLQESDRLRQEADRERELAIQRHAETERLASLEREKERSRRLLGGVAVCVLLLFTAGAAAAAWVFDAKRREARAAEAEAVRVLTVLGIVRGELGFTQGELDEALSKARVERNAMAEERNGRLEAQLAIETAERQAREERSLRTRTEERLAAERKLWEQERRSIEASAESDLADFAAGNAVLRARIDSLREIGARTMTELVTARGATKEAEASAREAADAHRATLARLDAERELRLAVEQRARRDDARDISRIPEGRPREVHWIDLDLRRRSEGDGLAEVLRRRTSRERPCIVWLQGAVETALIERVSDKILGDDGIVLSLIPVNLYRVDVDALEDRDLRGECDAQLGFHFLDPAGNPASDPLLGRKADSLSSFSNSVERLWETSFDLSIKSFRRGMRRLLDRIDALIGKALVLENKLAGTSNPTLGRRIRRELAAVEEQMRQVTAEEQDLHASCALRAAYRPGKTGGSNEKE